MALSIGTPLPSLDGATEWIDGDIESATRSGSPLLVQFWSLSCPACKNGMPRVLDLLSTYEKHNLRLLSIHMPRGPWEIDVDKVKSGVADLGLRGQCAIDNDHTLGKAFETAGRWPSYFFFDADGRLRSRAAGQLGLKMAENSLKRILGDTESTIPERDSSAIIGA